MRRLTWPIAALVLGSGAARAFGDPHPNPSPGRGSEERTSERDELEGGFRARAGGVMIKAIAPGNEALVAEMLGAGAPLADGCALEGAAIERTRIVATYGCGGATATLVLLHPSDPEASRPAATTATFALVARGEVPRPLVEAIVARVTARETGFRWMSTELPGPAQPARGQVAAGSTPPPHRFFVSPVSFGAAALAVAAVSGLLQRLLRRRPRAPA